MRAIEDELEAVLALPRRRQPDGIRALLARLPPPPSSEAWNTRFGPSSLYDAWTQTTVAREVYRANAAVLARALVDRGPGWTAVEVGGGDGRLWRLVGSLAQDLPAGRLVLIDPVPETAERVRDALPRGVTFEFHEGRVQDVRFPTAHAVVMSLVLHHVAGADGAERARHGLTGPGKLEVLVRVADAIRPTGGLALLNEADVHCDLELAPGEELLADRLIDSYLRRCGRSIARDLRERADADDSLVARWRAILRRWCLEQIAMAAVPIDQRDVYELDVPRWRALLDRAGLWIRRTTATDEYGLFFQYVLEAR